MTDFDPVLVLIDRTLPRVRKAAVNMANGMDHHPSSGNGGGSGKGGHSDPVYNLIERHDEYGDDRAAEDLRAFNKHLRAIADLVDSWAPNNVARAHRATQGDDRCPTGQCESCWRDHGYRTPARTIGSRMCKWCENWARELNVDLPPLMLVERRHQGKKITDRDVRIATAGRTP